MEKGLELRSQDTTGQANNYLAYLMGRLEADKKKLTQPHTKVSSLLLSSLSLLFPSFYA
jgi:hypothetical protein